MFSSFCDCITESFFSRKYQSVAAEGNMSSLLLLPPELLEQVGGMWSLYICDQIPIVFDSRLLAAFWVICWECTGSLWNGFKTCISRCFWISPSGTWLSAARFHDLNIIITIFWPEPNLPLLGFSQISAISHTILRSAQPYKWWPRSCSQQLT